MTQERDLPEDDAIERDEDVRGQSEEPDEFDDDDDEMDELGDDEDEQLEER